MRPYSKDHGHDHHPSKSLDQAVRDDLEQLAGAQQLRNDVQAFEASARSTPGRLGNWRFDRGEANTRR